MGRKTQQNKIVTQEILAQINQQNQQLMDDFLEYLESTQRSETTIRGYESDILIAWAWCAQFNHNKFFVDWTKRDIISYQNWMINVNKNSPARVRRLKAALSSLSNFIEQILDDEYPNFRNIINKIESPVNHPVREKTVWSDDELQNLLDRLTENEEYEKACLLALGIYSGRRKAELCRFKVTDFDKSNLICDGALYKSNPIKTKGRGGGKYICCYTLAKKFDPYLSAWLDERNRRNIQSEWLFPSSNDPNEHITISTLNSWANTFSRISGKACYLHSLRHAFTTSLVRAGIPDNVITQIVGWESADMCKIYTDIDADEQIGMYFKDGDIAVPDKKGFGDI